MEVGRDCAKLGEDTGGVGMARFCSWRERRDVRGTASRIGCNEAILRMRCFIVIFVRNGIVRLQLYALDSQRVMRQDNLERVKEVCFKTIVGKLVHA